MTRPRPLHQALLLLPLLWLALAAPGCATVYLLQGLTARDRILEGQGQVQRLRWRGDSLRGWQIDLHGRGGEHIPARPVELGSLGKPLPLPAGSEALGAMVPSGVPAPGGPEAVILLEVHGVPHLFERCAGKWSLHRAVSVLDEHSGPGGVLGRVLLMPLAIGWDAATLPAQLLAVGYLIATWDPFDF